jgi:hypothetical protein
VGTPEAVHLALNDTLGLNLGMSRDALPRATRDRDLRCALPDRMGYTRCKLLINDEVIFAGARVLAAEVGLDKDKVTDITFYLNASHMGPKPLAFLIQKKFGEQFPEIKPPVTCWQHLASSLVFFAGEGASIIMSLNATCAKYQERLNKK